MNDCKATLLFARSLGGGGIAKLGARLRKRSACRFLVLCGVHVSEPVI